MPDWQSSFALDSAGRTYHGILGKRPIESPLRDVRQIAAACDCRIMLTGDGRGWCEWQFGYVSTLPSPECQLTREYNNEEDRGGIYELLGTNDVPLLHISAAPNAAAALAADGRILYWQHLLYRGGWSYLRGQPIRLPPVPGTVRVASTAVGHAAFVVAITASGDVWIYRRKENRSRVEQFTEDDEMRDTLEEDLWERVQN